MALAAALSKVHHENIDYYKDQGSGRLERALIARAGFLDAGLKAVLDLPSRVLNFAYEFFRSLTVGVVFSREQPRARLIEEINEFLGTIGQIFLGAVGVLCPHLVHQSREWINRV